MMKNNQICQFQTALLLSKGTFSQNRWETSHPLELLLELDGQPLLLSHQIDCKSAHFQVPKNGFLSARIQKLRPTSPQNGGVCVCFNHLPLLGEY